MYIDDKVNQSLFLQLQLEYAKTDVRQFSHSYWAAQWGTRTVTRLWVWIPATCPVSFQASFSHSKETHCKYILHVSLSLQGWDSAGAAVVDHFLRLILSATFNIRLALLTLRSCLKHDKIVEARLKCPALLDNTKLCSYDQCSKVLLSHSCVSSWGITKALTAGSQWSPDGFGWEKGRFEWDFNLTSTNKQPRQQY